MKLVVFVAALSLFAPAVASPQPASKVGDAYAQFLMGHRLEEADDDAGAIAAYTRAMALDPQAAGRLSATSTDARVLLELALTEFHVAPEEVRGVLDPFEGAALSRPLDEPRLRLALARSLAEANGGHLSVALHGPDEVVFVLELQKPAAPVAA